MKRLPLNISLVLAILLAPAWAEKSDNKEKLEINKLGKDDQYAWVDNGWDRKAECIELSFSTANDMASKNLSVRVYLYDSKHNLLHSIRKISSTCDNKGNTKQIAPKLESGERNTVYFAVPGEFQKGATRWRKCVVVLEEGDQIAARAYPREELSYFDFPGKAKVIEYLEKEEEPKSTFGS